MKELLTEDAIIAGGFPLAVYLKVESTKEDFLPLLLKKLTNPTRIGDGLSYTDIDIWAKSSSSNQILNNLIDLNPVTPLQMSESSITLTKKSKWANTFSVSTNNRSAFTKAVQFVKVRYQSPEDLISTFDLNICKVAWCNGSLFVSEEVMNDIRTGELSFSPNYDFGEQNFITRVYRSLRFIKYAMRYNLEPSADICEYIFKTFADSSGDNLKYGIKNQTAMVNINNYYKGSDKIYDMYHSMICNSTYEWFSKCKNFKKEWSLFLINHPIITIIQSLIEGRKNTSPFQIIF